MKPPPTFRALAGATVLFLAASASAWQSEPYGQYHQYDWPTSGAYHNTQPFGRGVAGDFDGDERLDAVILDGNVPVVLFAPDSTTGFSKVLSGVTANDVAVLRGGMSGTGVDELLFANNNGLYRTSWSGTTHEFTTAVAIETTEWAGVRELDSRDVDGDGDADVVGVRWNALVEPEDLPSTILAMSNDGTGFSTPPLWGFDSLAFVYHLVLIEYDDDAGEEGGDAGCEIAVSTQTSARVYEVDGIVVKAHNLTPAGPLGGVAAVRLAGQTRERFALVTPDMNPPTASQTLVLFGRDENPTTITIGQYRVVGVSAGDENGDGSDDLYLSHTLTHEVRVLHNLWTPGSLDPALYEDASPHILDLRLAPASVAATAAGMNAARAVVGDFDSDGDDDMVFPVEGSAPVTKHIHVVRGGAVDEADFRVSVTEGVLLPGTGGNWTRLVLDVYPPAAVPDVVTPSTNELYLDAVVWKQPSATGPVDEVAIRHLRFALRATGVGLNLDLTGETAVTFDTVFRVQISVVEAENATAAPAIVYPAFSGALAASEDSMDVIFPQADSHQPPLPVNDGSGFARADAGFIEKPDVRPFSEGDVPKRGNPVTGTTTPIGS